MQKLEASGVVRRVHTCKCASNVVLVDKGQQGQEHRMCCNFVDLNPYTAPAHYPIPQPAYLIDESREANLWSTLDIKSCYHNFEVTEEAQPYLGITTQDGLYIFQRMPFGMDTASQWCQYAMDAIVARA